MKLSREKRRRRRRPHSFLRVFVSGIQKTLSRSTTRTREKNLQRKKKLSESEREASQKAKKNICECLLIFPLCVCHWTKRNHRCLFPVVLLPFSFFPPLLPIKHNCNWPLLPPPLPLYLQPTLLFLRRNITLYMFLLRIRCLTWEVLFPPSLCPAIERRTICQTSALPYPYPSILRAFQCHFFA